MTTYLAFFFVLRAAWFFIMALFCFLADARRASAVLFVSAFVPGPFETWFTWKTCKVIYGLFQIAYPPEKKR